MSIFNERGERFYPACAHWVKYEPLYTTRYELNEPYPPENQDICPDCVRAHYEYERDVGEYNRLLLLKHRMKTWRKLRLWWHKFVWGEWNTVDARLKQLEYRIHSRLHDVGKEQGML